MANFRHPGWKNAASMIQNRWLLFLGKADAFLWEWHNAIGLQRWREIIYVGSCILGKRMCKSPLHAFFHSVSLVLRCVTPLLHHWNPHGIIAVTDKGMFVKLFLTHLPANCWGKFKRLLRYSWQCQAITWRNTMNISCLFAMLWACSWGKKKTRSDVQMCHYKS